MLPATTEVLSYSATADALLLRLNRPMLRTMWPSVTWTMRCQKHRIVLLEVNGTTHHLFATISQIAEPTAALDLRQDVTDGISESKKAGCAGVVPHAYSLGQLRRTRTSGSSIHSPGSSMPMVKQSRHALGHRLALRVMKFALLLISVLATYHSSAIQLWMGVKRALRRNSRAACAPV
jgi:hypothetical protein